MNKMSELFIKYAKEENGYGLSGCGKPMLEEVPLAPRELTEIEKRWLSTLRSQVISQGAEQCPEDQEEIGKGKPRSSLGKEFAMQRLLQQTKDKGLTVKVIDPSEENMQEPRTKE